MAKKRNKNTNVVMVPIAEIQKNLFVRRSLNDDRVMEFMEMIEAGATMDPVVLTSDFRMMDGRHRLQAYELCDKSEIPAVIIKVKDEIDMITRAYKANTGGALPPTKADTEHTVSLLLEQGATQTSIIKVLGWPPSMARKFIAEVKSRRNKAALMRAVDAVTAENKKERLSITAAAETHGVDEKKLREQLSGKKNGKKKGRMRDIPETKKVLSQAYRSMGVANARKLKDLFGKFEDGEITKRDIDNVFKHIEKLQRKAAKGLADWRARFDAQIAANKRGAAA